MPAMPSGRPRTSSGDWARTSAALLGRLNAENVKGRGDLAAELRAEIEQSRAANVEGREKLAADLRTEIEQSRTATPLSSPTLLNNSTRRRLRTHARCPPKSFSASIWTP